MTVLESFLIGLVVGISVIMLLGTSHTEEDEKARVTREESANAAARHNSGGADEDAKKV